MNDAPTLIDRCASAINERMLYLLCRHYHGKRGAWRLDLPRRAAEFRFPESGTMVTHMLDGAMIEVRKNDVIGNSLHFFGRHDPTIETLAAAELRTGDIALDLGANIGAVTLQLARLVGETGRVFAVEALGSTAGILVRNVERSGVGKRVHVEQCAVGREAGKATLYFNSGTANWGGVSLLDKEGSASEEIRIETLDALWTWWGRPQFSFVKMDVEGFELDVLAGATALFTESPPRTWVVEFNTEHLGKIPDGVSRLWSEFVGRGYVASDKSGVRLDGPPTVHADVVFRLET